MHRKVTPTHEATVQDISHQRASSPVHAEPFPPAPHSLRSCSPGQLIENVVNKSAPNSIRQEVEERWVRKDRMCLATTPQRPHRKRTSHESPSLGCKSQMQTDACSAGTSTFLSAAVQLPHLNLAAKRALPAMPRFQCGTACGSHRATLIPELHHPSERH